MPYRPDAGEPSVAAVIPVHNEVVGRVGAPVRLVRHANAGEATQRNRGAAEAGPTYPAAALHVAAYLVRRLRACRTA